MQGVLQQDRELGVSKNCVFILFIDIFSRFVLADTERLHRKLSEMSDRIRQLEDALSTLHAKVSQDGDCHPLLQSDLLGIKTLQEVHANPDITSRTPKSAMRTSAAGSSDYIDAFGTLAIRNDGAETFYGRSAGSEVLSSSPSCRQELWLKF